MKITRMSVKLMIDLKTLFNIIKEKKYLKTLTGPQGLKGNLNKKLHMRLRATEKKKRE